LTSHIFHRELLHRFSTEEIETTVESALKWLEGTEIEASRRTAIKHRLESRREILRLFKTASDPALLSECSSGMCLVLLNEIKLSTRLGAPILESFSLKIQRTLASSVPPRPMIKIEDHQVFSFMTQLLIDLSQVHELLTLDHPGRLLPGFWTFMSRTPPSSVYVRAVTQSIVGRQDDLPGKCTLKEFMFKDLRRLVLPGSVLLDSALDIVKLPSDQRFQVTRQLDDFVFKCGQSYLNIYRTYCLNRCRIRRTLCHAVMEWDGIQADAEECDAAIQLLTNEHPQSYPLGDPLTYSYPLSSWIYHHKLDQMETIILMGFELSIYAPDEIPKLYWHLSQIIAVHVSHLDRMSHFADQITQSHGTSTLPEQANTAEKVDCLKELYREYARLKAIEALALSLHLVHVFLLRNSLSQRPPRQYNDDQLRYELRMRPFLTMSVPNPMPFDEYQEAAVLPELTDIDILDRASRQCSLAKRAWEEILKACVLMTWKSR
jgi:N-alpha-acetyltransferase 35, NatC auxiliary subunit